MTWDSERDDEIWDDHSAEEPSAEIRIERAPAIWPVFVAYVGAVIAIFVLQAVLAVVVLVWLLANGANLQEIANELKDAIAWPGLFTVFASASQLVIAGAALIGAWCSGDRLVRTLGFGKPALPWFAFPIVIVGSMGPGLLCAVLASNVRQFLPEDPMLELVVGRLTWTSVVPFVLFISLTPGFAEEAFFRGYLQRRLLLRWPPRTAILVSAALFGLLHFEPHLIVFAFTLGLWLGVLAWRTGSIWPGILAHVVWNAGSVSWSAGEHLLELPENPPLIPSIVGGVVVLGCFIASIWLLARTTPPGPDDEILLAELAPD